MTIEGEYEPSALQWVRECALVASYGGADEHPVWYHDLVADPGAVQIQDGPTPFDVTVREVATPR